MIGKMILSIFILLFFSIGVADTILRIAEIVIKKSYMQIKKMAKKKQCKKNMDEINYTYNFNDNKLEKEVEKVEQALGFRLYRWQKSYIETGVFRCYGETTAECIRDLLMVDACPIDFSDPRCFFRELTHRNMMREIQEKLSRNGIKTRRIIWTKEEKDDYINPSRFNTSNK